MTDSTEGSAPLLAIDPGTAKWGLAVVEPSGNCLFREVVPHAEAMEHIELLLARYSPGLIALGDRTGATEARRQLNSLSLPLTLVPEHRTTLLARSLYWRDHPPQGWRRWIPLGLQTPPIPLDAYAAEALALRYFGLLDEFSER